MSQTSNIYMEYVAVGASMKATAIDGVSGREASVVGPVNAARSDLERLAVRKLQRLLSEDSHNSKPSRR